MKPLLDELKTIFKGEITSDAKVLEEYSHDASIYEMTPEAVLSPRSSTDIKRLVRFVSINKSLYPNLSITPRSAGTDMTGSAIGDSLVIDMTKHFNKVHAVSDTEIHSQPGVFIRDIDPLLDKRNVMLGCIPASRAYNTIGGMVANNSAGEQSLRYGNTDKSIREVSAVLSDGNEYTFKPISKKELFVKIAQGDFEGELYRKIYELIEAHYDLIKNARPKTHKNSMGYNLWTTWDRDTGIFDMTQLLTGSQGTLGIITDIKMATVPKAKHSGLLLAYLTKVGDLAEIVPLVTSHSPATFEGFDNVTFELGIKYFRMFRSQLGTREWLKQQASLLSSVAKFKAHLPNIVLMIGFEGDTYQEVNDKILAMDYDLQQHHISIRTEIEGNEELSQPFWNIRRASLSLLRNKIEGKYASAFMDDMAVQPRYVPEFIPKVRKIIRKYNLAATISGHFGDGNFHIVPLMDITDPKEQLKLEPAMRELIQIVLEYKGTMAGEHNDGMIRGPWLAAQFGEEMYERFRDVKDIFDSRNIFNPHKKTDAAWDFSMKHVRTSHRHNFYR
jgi:FAD/FMN-containing dehydrogenase